MGSFYSPLQPIRESGKRRKFRQRDPGEPQPNTDLVKLWLSESHCLTIDLVYNFVTIGRVLRINH